MRYTFVWLWLVGAAACQPPTSPDLFADAVVSFKPGPGAGFGSEGFPDIVLGPPLGEGEGMGSLHVLSLGKEGEIVLEFLEPIAVDGPGPDLVVFENPFIGWVETGVVAVSEDGQNWREFPCATNREAGTFTGCAGVKPVFASPLDGVGKLDAAMVGGDAFDLAEVQLPQARFVRIRDSGQNTYAPPGGGFDLDAVGAVNTGR